ncbi:hypothetical protein DKR59_20890 [Salmonella enterica]|nr:hypothetical protein [Salmonella enterica]HAC6821228.1 hypothetical protein [Salmonella enterica subsp. enterica serovar Panama]EBI9019270.1 hypothetical protein [Salmonella enterica]EBJ1820352.1 hypothetical protein [Salmonella enterica]EBJ3312734.1 hypothetical protein [Salmonella enterica]
MLIEEQIPAVIDGEKQSGRTRVYMPQSIKRGSGHANPRNREAVTLALKGRYVLSVIEDASLSLPF